MQRSIPKLRQIAREVREAFSSRCSILGLTSMVGFASGNIVVAPTLSYQTSASSTSNTDTYTFSATAIGTAAADRRVYVVAYGGATTGSPQIDTCTIGGVLAQRIVRQSSGVSACVSAGIFVAQVPTGTTADIVVVYTAAMARSAISVWSVTGGINSLSATDSDDNSSDPATKTLTTTADGFLIAGACNDANTTITWTNATERADAVVETALTYSGADAATTGADISPSADFASAGTNRVGVFATFR